MMTSYSLLMTSYSLCDEEEVDLISFNHVCVGQRIHSTESRMDTTVKLIVCVHVCVWGGGGGGGTCVPVRHNV